ncbi:MAG TPA: site-2 protease family protein [Candidatus Avoscillospira avicola]|uniref:Site-2 protease family protein n=1 Tax=Candidatus Avoscillospira avicola TaxID=2840706 RepID=A0A9D1DG53_9FIRM|nr:site-2 protease family protein [Candidatus Avoscillospira avicola]
MYILLAILIFGVLIFTHELGHFLVAKAFHVRVNEFALFMGPALWKREVGETTYSIRCIPIGGYCAMEGEDGESDDPRSFTAASAWKRALILVAGAAFNFLTGLIALVILYSTVFGFSTPQIVDFYEGCPLESESGLQVGDTLYSIDGERVYLYSDVSMLLSRNSTGVYDLVVRRDGKLVELKDFEMTQQAYEENGQTVYRYGLYFGSEGKNVGTVLKNSWLTAVDIVRIVRMSLQDLVTGFVSIDEMSGPVGIVSVIADTGEQSENAAAAALNITYLAAFIAVNLAVVNLLPIPALDGGRIFFLIVTWVAEKLLRRKIDPKYENYIHAAGMILLLLFIAFITFKDIGKLIGG